VERFETRLSSDQAKVNSLKKQLESFQVKISYGHILAPISGHVARRLAEPGDAVFPGKPVYILTSTKGGRVIVPVPLDTVTRIKTGGKVQLSLGTQQITTRITRINPSLDTLSMGSLEIDLPERPFDLPDGAPVAARVITDETAGLTVPLNALRPSKQQKQRTLFKVVQNKQRAYVKLTPVRVQLCGKQGCVIDGDIKEGDRVVTAHGSILLQLHDGDEILNNWTHTIMVQP